MRAGRLRAVGVFLLASLAAAARAADTGQFQLIIAAPDPVVAGERMQFQAIAVNQGTEVWRSRKYHLQVEVYDAERNYLAQTDKFRGTQNVNPGETFVASVAFDVPVNYSGKYLYRAFLVNQDQRIIEGDYRPFVVREKPLSLPKPPPVALGGNVVASYKNDSGPDDYVGNLSVNLVGRLKERSFLFNTYTFHGPDDAIDVYTVLLNYYGPNVTAGLGDVSPTFSPLSVYGQGMRGALAESRVDWGSVGWGMSLVGARTAESEEGTSTTDGIFRRMLYGAKNEVYLPGRVTVRANYVNSFDVEDSLVTPGPTLKPVDSRVAGGGATWELVPGVKLEGDYQSSAFEADRLSTAAAVTDGAWRGALSMDLGRFTFNGYMQRTGTDFVALGAPNATRDRLTYDGGLTLSPWSWASLYGTFNRYRDNLDDDPAKVTTTQQIANGGLNFSLPTYTGFNVGYSLNTAVGEPRTAQDNETATVSLGMSQSWKGQGLAFTLQKSDFKDKTKSTNDLVTDTVGSSLNLAVGGRVTASLGATLSDTTDQVDKSVQETQSLSASMNVDVVRSRLFMQLWGTLTSSEDDDVVNKSDREDTSLNVEFTWQASSKTAVTLGAFRNETKDAITPATDETANGGNARISYSF
jgi:hypothetical protein